jgi:hypothetical protein
MKDRLSFRTADVSPFSRFLLESVDDYSGTTRYAIDLLGWTFHPVLLIAHKSGVTLFDSIETVCRLSYGAEEITEVTPQAQWSFASEFGPTAATRALPSPDPLRIPVPVRPASESGPLSAELRNTIGAGLDLGEPSTKRDIRAQPSASARPVEVNEQIPEADPLPSPKIPAGTRPGLSRNLLDTIGAGIDRGPSTVKPLSELIAAMPPEERARLATLKPGVIPRTHKSSPTE